MRLYYHCLRPAPADYTQFIHLNNPESGLAAQYDAQPQSGNNPTSSWLPGEDIMDEVTLTVRSQASPGRYTLQVGLYDPADQGARVPMLDAHQEPLPDDHIDLTEIIVQP